MLSDLEILRARSDHSLKIEPFDPLMMQPASIDLRLGDTLRFAKRNEGFVDPKLPVDEHWSDEFLMEDDGTVINPGDFVLGSTVETVTLSPRLAARVEGKSSLGRLGLLTHITAGFIDPGFSGQITLELKNVNTKPIILYPGMKIAQLCFIRVDGQVHYPYGSKSIGSHYQGQRGPQLSQSHLNFYQMENGIE